MTDQNKPITKDEFYRAMNAIQQALTLMGKQIENSGDEIKRHIDAAVKVPQDKAR